MEQLKHECGVAMIRLLKPIEYYKEKYGSYCYGLSKLYLMMEKQHNRGQEAAGMGVIKMGALPGNEYVFRERAEGSSAIQSIFDSIRPALEEAHVETRDPEWVQLHAPFIGEIYMGHLRYSTTGKSGISYVHPFLRRNNWRSRNLLLCGNFNMTNVDRIFERIVATGQHPRIYSDTVMLLEQLGFHLDKENHRVYRMFRDTLSEPDLAHAIENNLDMRNVLANAATDWDGGFVICGATGSGDMFALRDPSGIRPAFYYSDDEIAVVASERPVIQTVLNVARDQVHELQPGCAFIISKGGNISITQVLTPRENRRCSFERIYFSRGSDADIYKERKALGRNLVDQIVAECESWDDSVFSFIPNTAEVAFIGMIEGLQKRLEDEKCSRIIELQDKDELSHDAVRQVLSTHLRVEKIAIKDIKLRTFIAEGESRNDLASHVYDVTYGCVVNNRDTLVVIDDSIVRGTTLRQSIIRMLDRLHPRKIVIVSSAPQVRYPDYYGIDMSRMGEFIAFRAAVQMLRERGREDLLRSVYDECRKQEFLPDDKLVNCVKAVYEPFTDKEISAKIAEMLTPRDTEAKITIIYQTLEGLHKSVPDHPGDWYFSGDYPTAGGIRLVNKAYVNFYEGNIDKR